MLIRNHIREDLSKATELFLEAKGKLKKEHISEKFIWWIYY